MKLLHRLRSVAILAAFFIASPAVAQWQVPSNEIPVGRGAGTGFTSNFTRSGTGAVARTVRSKLQEYVSITDFGATADAATAYSATFAAANATALTNALATGKCVHIPYNANGYSFAGSITVASGGCIEGESQVLLKSQSATSFLKIVAFNFPMVQISNLHIDMTGSGASSTAILLDTTSIPVYAVKFSMLYFTNCVEAIADNSPTTPGSPNAVVDIRFDDIRSAFTRGTQIHIRNSTGFMQLNRVQIDNTANVGAVTWNSIQFDYFAGIEFNAVDVTGPTSGTYQAAVYGIYLDGTSAAAVWFNRVNVDTTSGNGIFIGPLNYAWLNAIDVNNNMGNQVVFVGTNKVEIVNSFAGGAKVRGGTANASGWDFTSCTHVHVSNTSTENNTGSGFRLNNTTDSIFTNVRSTDNTVDGIVEIGTSNRNLVANSVFSNNSVANVVLIGAQSKAINYQSSGTYTPGMVSSIAGNAGPFTLSGGITNSGNDIRLANNSAVLNGAPATPGGITGASQQMLGLGVSTCRITPVFSTRLRFTIIARMTNATGGNSTFNIRYGTGAGPANGAAATGTAAMGNSLPLPVGANSTQLVLHGLATGLTPGTAVWFDPTANATAGTLALADVTCMAEEF